MIGNWVGGNDSCQGHVANHIFSRVEWMVNTGLEEDLLLFRGPLAHGDGPL